MCMQADTRIFQLEQHCGQWINLPKQPNVVNGCHNVKMHCVKFIASGNNPNTDDIHVQLSSSVTILNSKIRTGDDCLSIGPNTSNLWNENVACGLGHGIRHTIYLFLGLH